MQDAYIQLYVEFLERRGERESEDEWTRIAVYDPEDGRVIGWYPAGEGLLGRYCARAVSLG